VSTQGGGAVGRLRALLLNAPLRWLAAAGVSVVVVSISAAFGGFEAAEEPPLPRPALNTVFAGRPWNVTIHAVRVFGELKPLVLREQNNRWLAVVATVEITSAESTTLFNDALRVKGVQGLLTERVADVRYASTGGHAGFLQPNIPERVGFFWELAAHAPIPDVVDVEIYGATYHDPVPGNYYYGWVLDTDAPLAHLRVNVEDRRNQT
jgi:hypothetical protein